MFRVRVTYLALAVFFSRSCFSFSFNALSILILKSWSCPFNSTISMSLLLRSFRSKRIECDWFESSNSNIPALSHSKMNTTDDQEDIISFGLCWLEERNSWCESVLALVPLHHLPTLVSSLRIRVSLPRFHYCWGWFMIKYPYSISCLSNPTEIECIK